MKEQNPKFLQRRRFLMVVPVLVLPFVTMLFWALGGGQAAPAQATSLNTGLNLNLPDAHFLKANSPNKLGLYEQAKSDSLKFREARENDPYFDLAMIDPDSADEYPLLLSEDGLNLTKRTSSPSEIDENEKKIEDRLDLLTKELAKAERPTPKGKARSTTRPANSEQFKSDVDRLEAMMSMMQKGDQPDPEMQELSGVLDKILDIQNPDRARERIKELSSKTKDHAFPVETASHSNEVTLLGRSTNADTSVKNSFLGLGNNSGTGEPANAIEAVIHETQELVAGSTVKLRLLTDIFINGQLLSKDQFLFGTCDLNSDRLSVSISSIRVDNSLLPVNLIAYDVDGIEGLYIPGAIARDAAKQSSDQIMQGMQIMSLDPSIGAQAAAAGIQAAKGFLGRKVKAVRVTVKAGYKVLLRDSNSH